MAAPAQAQDAFENDAMPTERELFLSMLRAEYWAMIDDGMLPPKCRATMILLNSADLAMAHSYGPLCDWEYLLAKVGRCHACGAGFMGTVARFLSDFKEG